MSGRYTFNTHPVNSGFRFSNLRYNLNLKRTLKRTYNSRQAIRPVSRPLRQQAARPESQAAPALRLCRRHLEQTTPVPQHNRSRYTQSRQAGRQTGRILYIQLKQTVLSISVRYSVRTHTRTHAGVITTDTQHFTQDCFIGWLVNIG